MSFFHPWDRRIVVALAILVPGPLRQVRLGEIRLQTHRFIRCAFYFFTCSMKVPTLLSILIQTAEPGYECQPGPGQRERRVESHSFTEGTNRFPNILDVPAWTLAVHDSAQVCVIRVWVIRRCLPERGLLRAGELGLQCLRDSRGHLTLQVEDVVRFTVVTFCPNMLASRSAYQLEVDVHPTSRFLNAAFKNVRYAKLLRDLPEVPVFALVRLRGGARDDFQRADFRKPGQNFVLDSHGQIGIGLVFAQIFKR